MKTVYVEGQGKVTLQQSDFVAQGGEGSVYARGEVAFKLFADPARAITPSKIAELSRIADEDVLRPEALISERPHGPAMGHTMRFVPNAHALGELFPRAFKQRMGLSPARIANLVLLLAHRVRNVHAAGALVVDLSETNFLVDASLERVLAIDVDSYQTASHPATAITPSVRDPRATHLSEASDWFSFAVISFQLFIGLHPYRGTHPRLRGLSERMRRHACAGFDAEVRVPPAALPLSVIPEIWRDWYQAVLAEGKRMPPPRMMAAPEVAPAPRSPAPNGVVRTELFAVGEPIRQLVAGRDRLWALTDRALYADGEALSDAPQGAWLALSPTLRQPVLGWLEDGQLCLSDVSAGRRLDTGLRAQAIMAVRGVLYAKAGGTIVEVRLHDVGPTVIAAPRTATMVVPQATTLFDGVAVQRLLGATYVSIFPSPGRCLTARLPASSQGMQPSSRVLDARADGNVAMLLVAGAGGSERLVMRFDDAGKHDLRTEPSLGARGLCFVTLDRGICVAVDDHGAVDMFAAAPDKAGRRTLHAALGADLLAAQADAVLCAQGHRVYQIATRSDAKATQEACRGHAP